MSTTSHSMAHVRRQSDPIRLDSNPIVSVGSDCRLIDFEETRFRVHSLRLQNELRPLALELSTELGVPLSTLDTLSSEPDSSLKSDTYCTFDFMDVKVRRDNGFLRISWIPLAVFVSGERVFSLHSTYSDSGSKLVGLTMRREESDEYTKCSTHRSALKVARSYLRTYVQVTK